MVLAWHNVEGTWWFQSEPGRGSAGIERQFRILRRVANVVPLGAALRDLRAGRPLPSRAVAITFDDGYRDNLTIAGPMLARLGLPATCFLVPALLDGAVDPWWEHLGWGFTHARAPRVTFEGQEFALTDEASRKTASHAVSGPLKVRDRRAREDAVGRLLEQLDPVGSYDPGAQFLDWDGARALRRFMELGSHSTYHTILAQETPDEQARDLAGSRKRLSDELDLPIDVLAYPNGKAPDFDAHTEAAAERAGYSHSVTTEAGWTTATTGRHRVRRWVMNPERGPIDLGKFVRDAPLWRDRHQV